MNALRLAGRMMMRDLRAGELTVLVLALLVAVTAFTAVAFLADRVSRGVEREAHQLLGGDLLLSADHPWDERLREEAMRRGLRVAASASFLSMVSNVNSGDAQLAEIKAISSGYPLRGALHVAARLKVGASATAEVPAPGTVWVDERLAHALGVDHGALVQLGAARPIVKAIVMLDPERGINPFALAPRLIVNLADLPATGLVQPGSRIGWHLHVAGEAGAIAAYREWASRQLGRGERIEGLDDARPEVRSIIERAQRFLHLAALLTVVLAAIAVGMAARRFLRRHLDACALMRCFGASEREILLIYGGEFIVLGGGATFAGGLLGYLVQLWLHGLLTGLLASELPPPGPWPWLQGGTVGLVLVAGFVVPPLLRLKSVPTLRVLRREWGRPAPLSVATYGLGAAGLAVLIFWLAGDATLGSAVLAGFLVAVGLFIVAARLLLTLTAGIAARFFSGGLRIGLASARRRRAAALVQVVALALGLAALLLLTLARTDLLSSWQAKIPPDAPNRFLINIQPEQRLAIADFFCQAGLPAPRLEPMVRGRLVAVNDKPVVPEDYTDERARRLVEREFNLSSRADLPDGNAISAGYWHGSGAPLQFSVEQGLAETLRLKLGDVLDFAVAGQHFSGTITSLRRLEWSSMRVNFFVIAPEGTLAGQPTSYITSFHLPDDGGAFITALVRAFPNLTVIDVTALVRQLTTTLEQVAHAVEFVFLFSLLAGMVVLYAAIEADSGERAHELALLRALGARRHQLWQVVLSEFVTLGAFAGSLAGVSAGAIGMLLARGVFHLDYLPSPQLMLTGLGSGLAITGLAGLLAAQRALAGPVIVRLRAAA